MVFSGNPADVLDLWEPTSIFRANWESPVRVATAFISDIQTSRTDAEQRRNLIGRPYRTVQASLLANQPDAVRRLMDNLTRQGIARSMVPLYSDQTYLTQASQGTLYCSTANRRFFVGGRVMVMNEAGEIAYSQIESITPTTIVLTDPLYQSFAKDSIVYPIIESRLVFESEVEVITSTLVQTDIKATELPSSASLDVLANPGSTPLGFSTYKGIPIFDVMPNYGEAVGMKLTRTGNFAASGVTQSPSAYGDNPRLSVKFTALLPSREKVFNVVRFFESRGGVAHPFWIASPASDYEVVGVSGDEVSIRVEGPENNWEWRKHLCQVTREGVFVREILSVFRSGFTDILTLDSPLPYAVAGSRVTHAVLARFAKDEMEEVWLTDEAAEIDIEVVEVVEEKTIDVANVPEPTTTPIPARFSPSTAESGEAAADVKMMFQPCGLPSHRPLVRAADLGIPPLITVTVASGQVEIDPDFTATSGAVSAAMLAAVQDTFECEYVGSTSQVSHHWHHLNYSLSPSASYAHEGDDVTIARHLYRATKTYTGADAEEHEITVAIFVENPTSSPPVGARGAMIHGFIFSDEVNEDYVDGDPYSPLFNAEFTRDNPAKYGGLVGRSAYDEMRLLHPQCVLHFFVPTSFESPCGNQPWGYDAEILRDGFDPSCKAVSSSIPWLPEFSGSILDTAFENIVYTDSATTPSCGVMLGGDCPTSSLFPFVVVENGSSVSGLTALRPLKDGLTDDRLNVLEGSAVSIDFCETDQSGNAISCCDGHPSAPLDGVGGTPKCWKAPEEAPAACIGLPEDAEPEELDKRCCFGATSTATVVVSQKCISERRTLNESCAEVDNCLDDPAEYNWFQSSSRTVTFSIAACVMDFAIGDSANRSMVWRGYFDQAIQGRYEWDDDFDIKDPLTWEDHGGTWGGFTAGTVTGTAGSGTDNVKSRALVNSSSPLSGVVQHINATVSVEADPGAASEVGVIVRAASGSGPIDAYLVTVDRDEKTVSIYRALSAGNVLTKIAEAEDIEGIPATGYFRIEISISGDSIAASIEGDEKTVVIAKNCDVRASGFGGLCILAGSASFKNYYYRGTPAKAPVTVSYASSTGGFSVSVPKNIIGEGWASCVSDETNCPELCGCSYVLRSVQPESISIDRSDSNTSEPGGGKPYDGHGLGCGIETPGVCPAPDGFHAPVADWVAATVRVTGASCTPSCIEGTSSACAGMDVWHGLCLGPIT